MRPLGECQYNSRTVTSMSIHDLRSASSVSTTRLLPKALALGLIGVRIVSSPSFSPSVSLRGTAIPKGRGVAFETPPFGASEGVRGGLGTVVWIEDRANPLRSG